MESLKEIHSIALPELKKRFPLNPVSLKYPFAERPLRTLVLVKTDGAVFSSEEFTRVLFLKIDFPVYLTEINTGYDNPALFDRLIQIKARYPALLSKTKKPRRGIEDVLSRAACLVKITEDAF